MALNLAAPTEIPGETGPHGTKVVHPPPSPEELAQHFPQFEILECLGRGGMGVVYRARQPKLDRFVALKILTPERVAEPKFAERFAREAEALARLSHPNIVTVYDFGETDGLYYLLMEFVDGVTLRQLLREGRMKPEEALAIVPGICEALQFAHEQGVVHRDIKPENVLLDKQGRVKIADFGIAKIAGGTPPTSSLCRSEGERMAARPGEGTLTQDQVLGTPPYMAPEQADRPQWADHRADIYSLGVVFYEMLTGELPLGKFEPPSKRVQVDVRLDEIVLRTLAKEPERRYQHASEVKTAVETIVGTPSSPSSGRESTPSGMSRLLAVSDAEQNAEEATLVLPFAYALFLAGTAGAWLFTTLFGHRDQALIFTLVMLALALILGALSWRHWLGKGVVMGSLLVLVVLALFPSGSQKQGQSSTEAQAVTEAPHVTTGFGSVSELTLNDLDDYRGSELLDLDTAKTLDLDCAFEKWPRAQQAEWLKTHGIDLMLDYVNQQWGLIAPQDNATRLVLVTNAFWDGLGQAEFDRELKRTDPGLQTFNRGGIVAYLLATNATPPLTLAFITANGSRGLFQIVGLTERSNSARLRFKLVQLAPTNGLVFGPVIERETPTVVPRQEHAGALLYLLPEGLSPMTFGFRTRHGDMGLLQITGFADKPRALKLHYKLLQATPSASTTRPKAGAEKLVRDRKF